MVHVSECFIRHVRTLRLEERQQKSVALDGTGRKTLRMTF